MGDAFLRLGLCVVFVGLVAVGCGDDEAATGGGGGNAGGAGGTGGSGGSTPASCEAAAADATRTCLADVNQAWRSCYADTDGPCSADDEAIAAALSALDATVTASCEDGEFLSLSVGALVGRLQTSCASEAMSLASRSFGGPQGASWTAASSNARACLQSAHETGSSLIDDIVSSADECLAAGDCDESTFASEAAELAADAETEIATACGALEDLVALTPGQYAERASHQSNCVIATTHAETAGLALSCGPGRVDASLPRGEYFQVILDGEEWGTRCGDGSPFAFQVRLAPEGEPLDRILIGMQGGGVCVFEPDCRFRMENSPGLFESLTDEPPTSGIMSNDPADNPFANWTKVYLPYCNQDVFAGGGVAQEFSDFSVERYGAINVRAAVEYVRNVLWGLLDEEGADGYRPDRIVAAFGGWSAGGFGTLYNYHWMLDDLQWPQTTGFPDAALALDSGGFTSVRTLGNILVGTWDAQKLFPPYCFVGDCAVGPDLYAATSPRLKAVPNQQLLILTNQNDDVQVGTTFFPSNADWINVERSSVCDTRDLDGIHYYLTTVVESVHVVSLGPLYDDSVDGVVMSDWLWNGVVADPDGISNPMEEGTFVEDIAGVQPFPCEVAP